MARISPLLPVVVGLALLAGCQAAPPGPASVAPVRRTTLDGVYTTEQALRGERVFRNSCKGCHSTSEWSYPSFLGRRSGQSVGDLFNKIYETMPRGALGSVTLEEYAEVVAYMLHLNGMPSGSAELGTDDAELQAIVIRR